MEIVSVKSRTHEELIDITHTVNEIVKKSHITKGICYIYTPHTTAAITINENADPDVKNDILRGLSHLKFENVNFLHKEGNSPSHIKSSLFGCSEIVFIDQGKLQLGTWQGVYFCEFDGPRTRKVMVTLHNLKSV
ncbi:MAG: secondary thiamine-phosphate synthase enzyme YjbQ [bacterium]